MKDNKKSMFKFFLKMLFIFIGIDLAIMLVSYIFATSSYYAKYGQDLIMEIFYAVAVLIVMLLFNNSYVFTERKGKFWKSVCLGMPMLLIALINFGVNLVTLKSFSLLNFANVLALSIFVGIAEEFLCRGWLQNEFIERFSDNKNSVIKSIILASLVFGVMHIMNIGQQTVFETILQIINATALGMLLGSVYYKSKNIWSVIFLHAFYDFALFLGEMNMVKDCTYGTPTAGIIVVNCVSIAIISVLWIFSALNVLNSTNFKEEKVDKKRTNIYKTIIFISFVLLFIPFEELVPNYGKYKTCYNYVETEELKNYQEYYPHYDHYYIEAKNTVSKFDDNAFGNNMEEITTDEEYLISFKLNSNHTVNVKNENTTYEVKLDIDEVENLELIENEDHYIVIIESLENNETIYYNKINKDDVRNSKDFIDFIANSFTTYPVPELTMVGYVTIENNNTKYPYFYSMYGDEFIIKNENLYLIR